MSQYIIILILLVFTACATTDKSAPHSQRVAQKYLEQGYAAYRAAHISNVKYNLSFDLTKDDAFSGVSHLTFQLDQPKDITIDFFNGTVASVKVNSVTIPTEYNTFFIILPQQHLVAGINTVEVQFSHPYSTTGVGLYRFVDPVDKKVYLYSDFEPYDAHLMFPCFDQPDLKATYQSKVVVPQNWTVVSSTLETEVKKNGTTSEWVFPESGIFSTYIFSLHAGEYKIWKSLAKTKTQTIPLRLMVRQSLAQYVNPEEWFTTTRNGFSYFEDYFGHPYAYKKYDQLIVPDFNSGAMENVGAVTFNERFISRTKKEREEERRLANVILHEMAHMWFGNLVTMKWWNDIWLNESFATFAATKGLVGATKFKEAWTAFYGNSKKSAYFSDQAVTTHPIEFNVANTDVVFANFDGITYGKGASVLKQLDFYISPEKFQTGLKNYFHKNAFKNTTLSHFMNEMSAAAGFDLTHWQQTWLQVPQVNTIQAVYKCENGKMKDFSLQQTAVAEFPTLRNHKTRLAVYNEKNGLMKKTRTIDMTYQDESTPVPELNDTECSDKTLVFANEADHDYVKLQLDDASMKAIDGGLGKIPDALVRLSLWGTLWEMVRDQQLVATKYFEIATKHLAKETDVEIISAVTERVTTVLEQYLPKDQKGKTTYGKLHPQWVSFLLKRTQAAQTVDEQKRWFDMYIQNLRAPAELTVAQKILDQKPGWLKFSIDQDRRWEILQHLSSFGVKNIQARIEREKKKDSSQRGANNYAAALATYPQQDVKEAQWTNIIQGPRPDMSLGKLRPIMGSLFPRHQEALHEKFEDRFYSQLLSFKKQPTEFLSSFMQLTPALCSSETQTKLQTFAQQNAHLAETVKKSLKTSAQEDGRCVKIRAKVAEATI